MLIMNFEHVEIHLKLETGCLLCSHLHKTNVFHILAHLRMGQKYIIADE